MVLDEYQRLLAEDGCALPTARWWWWRWRWRRPDHHLRCWLDAAHGPSLRCGPDAAAPMRPVDAVVDRASGVRVTIPAGAAMRGTNAADAVQGRPTLVFGDACVPLLCNVDLRSSYTVFVVWAPSRGGGPAPLPSTATVYGSGARLGVWVGDPEADVLHHACVSGGPWQTLSMCVPVDALAAGPYMRLGEVRVFDTTLDAAAIRQECARLCCRWRLCS